MGIHSTTRTGGQWNLSLWSLVAAFGTYFCMYAFRKPFTAAEYVDITLWGIDYKTILVTSQVLGYTISKFLGIKVIAEMQPQRRAIGILVLIGIAELALLGFALVPAPFNFVFLFINGLPLGMVFGLVLGFLEGRRQTEALTAGLCASFILADGATRSVGAYLLQWGCVVWWMPFASGLIFGPPLLVLVWMLTRIPAPTAEDVAARTERVPMNRAARWQFFLRYALGLTAVLLAYLVLTVLRSMRADFAPEIWRGLGTTGAPEVFASSEALVGLGVMLLSGMAVLVRDNRRAFFLALMLAGSGVVLIAIALVGLQAGMLSAFPFMVVLGLGLYLPYVTVHTTIFERLIAMTRDRGNIGYLLYLSDAFGYLGFVAVLFARNLLAPGGDFLKFFLTTSWVIAVATLILLGVCWRYFAVHPATRGSP